MEGAETRESFEARLFGNERCVPRGKEPGQSKDEGGGLGVAFASNVNPAGAVVDVMNAV